jgi:transcriptional regulator with XRE-family HTH domain
MTNYTLSAEMQKLKDAGMSQAQIARETGYDKSYVNMLLGTNCDTEQWEQDRQRHAEFFAGLTPKQEYDLYTKRRKEMDDE